MDSSFVVIDVVPTKTQFGLDQIRRSYKSELHAAGAIAAAPAIGDADETFSTMFLSSVTTPESGESATRIDLIYTGYITALPEIKKDFAYNIVSASSQNGAIGGFSVGSPVTLQFWAPSNNWMWFSTYQETSADSVDDPAEDINILSFSFAASAIPFAFTGDLFAFFRYNLFTELVTKTITSTEIVTGQYWQNVATKTKTLVPFTYLT